MRKTPAGELFHGLPVGSAVDKGGVPCSRELPWKLFPRIRRDPKRTKIFRLNEAGQRKHQRCT